ncbi:CotH kinase family protein [Hydrogenophaga taeniospiralis]|uniref:CotH kinase family protein n=1 Tax=Hydrogenophaga taeniospiralis TaxID=65656 RepID=UPI001CF9DA3F|nr:CotH kinase family protein [Hydrogenophaga taeniospiralis]MCB4362826.1 CotH kinase family protein [Hydrogenophaga taeniospiralis]
MSLHRIAFALSAALLLAACVEWDAQQPGRKPVALDEPAFSHESGFYDSDISVALSHPDPTVAVYYTLDGSDPDPDNVNGTTYRYKLQYPKDPGDPFGEFHAQTYRSVRYKHPIRITDRSKEPDRIARISTTLHDVEPYYVTPLMALSATQRRVNDAVEPINGGLASFNQSIQDRLGTTDFQLPAIPTIDQRPQARLLKGTVLRAIAIKKGGARSDIATASYFVIPRQTFKLPVVSLVTQEDRLFGYEQGVMVAGKTFDDFRRKYPSHRIRGGTAPANWHARGDDIPAHFQYFPAVEKPEKASMDQRIGVRVHGGFSRSNASKSLRLYARKRYGKNKFQHPVFGEDHNHKKLILRNSGNDFQKTMFKDAAAQAVVRHLNIETQGYQPVVTFINGEYWGLLNLREYFDTDHFSEKYAIPEKDIELVENNAVIEGDPTHWNLVMAFFEKSDLRREEAYRQASKLIDIDSLIDHQIANIFIGNVDWPHNNVKAWRYRGKAPRYASQGVLDGRWRWLQYDADLALTIPSVNILAGALHPRGTKNLDGVAWSTLLLRKLMENDDFRTRFINRFADLLSTTFDAEHTSRTVLQLQNDIRPEMPRHLERWKVPANVDVWAQHVQSMLTFLRQRPAIQRAQLIDQFQLKGTYSLTVDIPDARQGHIRINTLQTPDLPDHPGAEGVWTGIYFSGVPLELEAIAKPCYAFKRWRGIDSTNASTRITATQDTQVAAEFEPVCAP